MALLIQSCPLGQSSSHSIACYRGQEKSRGAAGHVTDLEAMSLGLSLTGCMRRLAPVAHALMIPENFDAGRSLTPTTSHLEPAYSFSGIISRVSNRGSMVLGHSHEIRSVTFRG